MNVEISIHSTSGGTIVLLPAVWMSYCDAGRTVENKKFRPEKVPYYIGT